MQSFRIHLSLFALLTVTGLAQRSSAATVATWADGNTGNWSSTNLWSTRPVVPDNTPTETFDAVLGSPSSLNYITLDSDRTVQNLTIQGQSLSGDPARMIHVVDDFIFTGGFLNGPKVVVDGHLTLSGQIGENSTVVLSIGGTATIQNFTVVGVFQQKGVASLSGRVGGASPVGPSRFDNEGTLTINGNAEIGAKLNNSGTVRVQSGSLDLSGIGGTSSGAFVVEPGALLIFGRQPGVPYSYDLSGSTVSGGGDILFPGSVSIAMDDYALTGTTTLAGNVAFNSNPASTSKLELNAGSLEGTADFHVTSSAIWRGGGMAGSGITYIDAGATLTSDTNGSFTYLARTMVNDGTVHWTGGIMNGSGTFENNSTVVILGKGTFPSFTNHPNALLNLKSGDLQIQGSFTNHGTVLVETSVALSVYDELVFTQDTVHNSGTIEVQPGGSLPLGTTRTTTGPTGIITLQSASASLGGDWTNQGTISLANSVLHLGGTFETADIGALQRDGASRVAIGGSMNITGTIFPISAATGSFELEGGTISGGNVRVEPGGRFGGYGTIAEDLDVLGEFSVEARFTINGDLTLASTAHFSMKIGYSFQRLMEAGVIPLQLDGTLSVSIDPDFLINVDPTDSFAILQSNQLLTGQFANVASGSYLLTSDGSGSFRVSYAGQNSIVLSDFQAVPEPGTGVGLVFAAASVLGLRRRARSGTRERV
jgi:hypothetical protein